jgi:hypothetical protein
VPQVSATLAGEMGGSAVSIRFTDQYAWSGNVALEVEMHMKTTRDNARADALVAGLRGDLKLLFASPTFEVSPSVNRV